ncbi:Hypothetical protein RAK1035_3534 [Roseovarius sp. AK1035]|nr:Hypothetical protein RAK1035_3534 [Roseovarius sp. AK1035]
MGWFDTCDMRILGCDRCYDRRRLPRFLGLLTTLMLIASLAHADPRSWRCGRQKATLCLTSACCTAI